MNFYLNKNGQKLGPYSVEQVQIFLQQGLVTPDDQVWAEGWPSWMAVSNVPGLVQAQPTEKPTYAQSMPHQATIPDNPQSRTAYAQGKSPGLACILSLVIVGLGQFYNGDWNKGWVLLITCVVATFFSLGLLWFIWAAFSAVDAYRVASRAKPLEQYFPM